ncbi:MAG TPA: ABC transporter permease [Acidimicrobiales bacterium]|nr:ABC transporter permease [Acidimicrobiales bacterium]
MHFLDGCFHYLTSMANWTGSDGIAARAVAQVELSALVVLAAALIGIGIGFYLGHVGHGGFVAVNAANAARAIPSLALLILLVIWPVVSLKGGGFDAAFLTLVALAIPPVLTNAYVAMREVDPVVIEAAKSVGMSSARRFFTIEIPLAAPLTVAGLRTAAVEVVATSTLAAYVSYNDLGNFIFAGLNTNNNVESFCGAFLVAVLSGIADLCLLGLYRLVTPKPLRRATAARSRGTFGVHGRLSRVAA